MELDKILGVPNEMMTSWEIEQLVKAKQALTEWRDKAKNEAHDEGFAEGLGACIDSGHIFKHVIDPAPPLDKESQDG